MEQLRISMKRHSYDIYDSDVMRGAVEKLQTELKAKKAAMVAASDDQER